MSTTSALHSPTGEWELVPTSPWPPQPASTTTTEPQVRTTPLLVAAGIIGGCGILLLVVYLFVATLGQVHGSVRVLLSAGYTWLFVVAGVAAVAVLHVRAVDRANRERSRLLVDEMRRTRCAVKAYVQEGLAEGIAAIGQVAGRVAELEQRVQVVEQLAAAAVLVPEQLDDNQHKGDDRYLAGYADGLAGRALGEGKVVPLNANGHSPSQSAT